MTGRCFRNSENARKATCGRASLSVLAARMGVSPSVLGRPYGTPGLRSPWQWRWGTWCLERGKGLRRVRFLSARGSPRCVRMELTCVPRKSQGPLRRDRCTWSRSPPRVSRLLCSPADGRLGRGERWAGPRASLRAEKSVSRGPVSRRGVARSREVVFQSFAERAHCSPQGLRRSTVPPGARGGPVALHPCQHWGSLVF